jgi:IclR family pca regulon transcriptional regulator
VRVLHLGFTVLESMEPRRIALPHLRKLLEAYGQSVNMAVLDGAEIVYVESLKGHKYRIGIQTHVGARQPAYATSLGKAILSRLPAERIEPLLDSIEFRRITPKTVGSREELLAQLERARARGYAVNDEESVLGVRSVGAPLVGRNGVVAAINVAMPSAEMSVEELEALVAPRLIATARAISALLGHTEEALTAMRAASPKGRSTWAIDV